MTRSLFAFSALAMTCLGGLVAQSAPVPRSKPKPAPDLARFERLADELRRAGDEALADDVMRAARKIAQAEQPDAPVSPEARRRVAGRIVRAESGAPLLKGIPVLGHLFEQRAAEAPAAGIVTRRMPSRIAGGRSGAPVVPNPPAPRAATPPPTSGDVQQYSHHHEVHHYFHNAPPAGVRTFGGATSAPEPSARGRVRSGGTAGGARAPATPTPRTQATPPTPPRAVRVPRVNPSQLPAQVQPPAPPAAPQPPAPAAVRAPRVSRAPAVQRGLTLNRAPVASRGLTQPRLMGEPAPEPKTEPPSGRGVVRGRSAGSGISAAPPRSSKLQDEVDGLQREVNDLRQLLQKLREQIRAKSPN